MNIYLYHKRHAVTGLNYFGKTTTNPYTYNGSGVYWNAHLKRHGFLIETLEVWEFDNVDECSKFALDFSVNHNIVESTEWANLILEDGKMGGNNIFAHSESARAKRKETIARRTANGNPLPNTNTPESISKANSSRAATLAKKHLLGIKQRGPDTKPRKIYEKHVPFVNRNSPESLAKAAATRARNRSSLSHNPICETKLN